MPKYWLLPLFSILYHDQLVIPCWVRQFLHWCCRVTTLIFIIHIMFPFLSSAKFSVFSCNFGITISTCLNRRTYWIVVSRNFIAVLSFIPISLFPLFQLELLKYLTLCTHDCGGRNIFLENESEYFFLWKESQDHPIYVSKHGIRFSQKRFFHCTTQTFLKQNNSLISWFFSVSISYNEENQSRCACGPH